MSEKNATPVKELTLEESLAAIGGETASHLAVASREVLAAVESSQQLGKGDAYSTLTAAIWTIQAAKKGLCTALKNAVLVTGAPIGRSHRKPFSRVLDSASEARARAAKLAYPKAEVATGWLTREDSGNLFALLREK